MCIKFEILDGKGNSVKTYENQLFSKVTSSGNESEDKYSTEYIEIDDVCLNISEDTSSIDKDAEADGYVAPKCCKHAVSEHKYSTEYTEIYDVCPNIGEGTSSVDKDAEADGYVAPKCCKHAVPAKASAAGKNLLIGLIGLIAVGAVGTAIAVFLNFIDTAGNFGFGESENSGRTLPEFYWL